MKVVKPLRLGFSFRIFEHRRKHHLVTTLFAAFPFDEPDALLPEVDMWAALAEELGRFGMFDQGMWKQRGEVLVLGYAHPPSPRPRPSCDVRLTMGSLDKQLYVFGDRRWTAKGPTDPTPFERMPISFERAFGGPSHAPNPHGKGATPIPTEDGGEIHPLPNVEHPKRLVTSKGDRPAPASFAPEDFTNHERFEKMGTYDDHWRKHRFPGLADDIDWSVFNLAPSDQQLDGFFTGDERIKVRNMHPDHPVVETSLPRVTGRVLLARGNPGQLESHAARLDTVVLVPHAKMGICLFRSMTEVDSFDAHEVTHCVAALEPVDGPKRPLEHYVEALAMRLDPDKAHLYFLRDRDFVPDFVPAPPAGGSETDPYVEAMQDQGLLAEKQRERMKAELAEAEARMTAAGLDTSELDDGSTAELEGPQSMDEVPAYVEKLEDEREQLERRQTEAREELDALLKERAEELGLTEDEAREALDEPPGGPPRFRADAELARLRELCEGMRKGGHPMVDLETKLADPAYEQHLRETEERLFEAYRASAHMQGAAPFPDDEAAALSRQRVLVAVDAGEPLGRMDLTGVDLSGCNLSGADLREALLERANLADADLGGAQLDGAVLTRADLRGAKLAQAQLERANLGHADLRGADLGGCRLRETIVDRADLREARLDGADLSSALVTELRVEGASFRRIVGWRVFFHRTDLRGTHWHGAKLEECAFIEANLEDVDMTNITLRTCSMLTVRADRLRLTGGDLGNLRLLQETRIREGHFDDSRLESANFRGADLQGAQLTRCRATGCELGDANLRGADLRGADLSGSYFVRTDLSEANLQGAKLNGGLFRHARLHGASFRGANLFSADFSRAVGDDRTSFSGCVLKRVIGMEAS